MLTYATGDENAQRFASEPHPKQSQLAVYDPPVPDFTVARAVVCVVAVAVLSIVVGVVVNNRHSRCFDSFLRTKRLCYLQRMGPVLCSSLPARQSSAFMLMKMAYVSTASC